MTRASSYEDWMRVALAEAEAAAEQGDVPVGAVLISAEGQELARGRNRREVSADATAHAEVEVLRNASLPGQGWRLEGATLIVTLEPCPMCAGALVNARVARVVYGARDPKAGALDSRYQIGRDGLLNHRLEVESGVLAADCAAALQRFFQRLRAAGEK